MATDNGKQWNGAERFNAIFPALGTVIPLRERLVYELPETSARSAMDREVQDAIKTAAEQSGASPEQISQWIDDFTFLGKPGLLSPVPVAAESVADELEGTWELVSRLTDGQPTNARSQLFYDVDRGKGRVQHLITMWTDQNHFERDAQQGTYLLIAMVELTFRQNDEFEVVVNSKGRLIGNFGDYENGSDVADEFRLVRRGNDARMVGVPTSYVALGGRQSGGYTASKAFNHALIHVGGNPGSIVFANSGLPALPQKGRTMDVVDTYVHVDKAKPLVAGWEPLSEYFERMTKPEAWLSTLKAMGKTGTALHAFQRAPSRETLARYSDLTQIKRTMKRG